MKRAAILAFGLMAALPASATNIEITRSCFDGFCLESPEAFMTVAADPVRRHYRVKFSRTQSILYIQTGPTIRFPHCAPHCEVVDSGEERRVFQPHTGRLVGRMIGPIEGCGGGKAFVYVYVYDAELNPEWVSVVPHCR